ncbi:MAG: ISKra4 family transposase, partial [Actinobacteria bacterium]|nr:ISKra4 family transposase [Actinomycetota bacterium]
MLNLPVQTHSPGLRRLTAIEAVRGSFAPAQTAVEQASGVSVGNRQIEALAQAAATDIEGFYAGRRPDPSPADRLLVIQVDGKGIVMRPEALREATATRARAARRTTATRFSAGAKTGRNRRADLAAVYDAAPVPRTAADVLAPPPPDTPAPTERRRGPLA